MAKNGNGYGNILGDARAENDLKMLNTAFHETSDYHALTKTSDFNIVVGRRGTGKSALYIKTSEYYEKKSEYRVIKITPNESDNLLVQSTISNITESYSIARYITSIAWRYAIIIEIAKDLSTYYKAKKFDQYKSLIKYTTDHKSIFAINPFRRMAEVVKSAIKFSQSPEEIPSLIAEQTQIDYIEKITISILNEIDKTAIVLLDKLDEGLIIKKISVSIVGGLALTAGKFSESHDKVYVCAYIRDNIFRLLSRYDRDFSRNIESCTLRLRWDSESLFIFITNRIRAALSLSTESHLKVWNRFAHRSLKDRDGFRLCLKNTLFRPRDLLSLLNNAYILANRASRCEIIEDDVNKAALYISETRLNDLIKEYDEVFPGIDILINCFKRKTKLYKFDETIRILDISITNADYSKQNSSDLAILNNGLEAFKILYGIGFLGINQDTNNAYAFSFDGSPVKFDSLADDTSICIHPCYWSSLGLSTDDLEESFLSDIYDDYTAYKSADVAQSRAKLIGSLVSELPAMPIGNDGASKFEDWCLRAVKILFAGKLNNAEHHPNKDAIQRRDIVATNNAQDGFWKRVLTDYASRQVIFEIKNYQEMSLNEYRQAMTYTNSVRYGKFIILITRTSQEGLNNTEKGWLREIFHTHQTLIFTIPAEFLSRCIGKLRSAQRFDYVEKQLCRQLDTYERNYLSLRHSC